MLITMHYLYESFTRLKNLQVKIEKELNTLKRREEREAEGRKNKERQDLAVANVMNSFNNAFIDLAMVVEESRNLQDGDTSPLMALQVLLSIIKKRVDKVKTVEELYEILKMITDPLEQWIENKKYERISYYDYSIEYRNHWCSRYTSRDSFNAKVLEKFCKAIRWRHDKINIFEMFCRNGRLSDIFAAEDKKADVYGLDSAKNINSDGRQKFRRLIYGDLKGCAISNVCFDIVACAPMITIYRELKAGSYVKTERDLLFRALDYLRPDGWLLYVIPYYRFYTEICVHLVKNYHNFRIFSSLDSKGSVYVICQKLAVPIKLEAIDMKLYAKLRNMPFNYTTLDILPDLGDIKLPDKVLEIKRFRGSELNEEELVEMHNLSKCTATFWKEQQVEKLSSNQARPLLPFNIGQLGLILTSGCLDGIVDEGNGYCHVVKGRVVKKVDTTENIDTHTHQVQIINTTSNRVEISAFLPDGTYKCLA